MKTNPGHASNCVFGIFFLGEKCFNVKSIQCFFFHFKRKPANCFDFSKCFIAL